MREPQAAYVIRLQVITIAWMLAECGVALTSSWSARSPALLAFGSDSLVELLSAFVVLLQFTSSFHLDPARAARWAGVLLLVLAAIVTCTSGAALIGGVQPQSSWPGIAITAAALVVMPMLSRAKKTAALKTKDRALAADAVQSATCAYLAAISLSGLAANAVFKIHWLDPSAALLAVPFLGVEGRRALRGDPCRCC